MSRTKTARFEIRRTPNDVLIGYVGRYWAKPARWEGFAIRQGEEPEEIHAILSSYEAAIQWVIAQDKKD